MTQVLSSGGVTYPMISEHEAQWGSFCDLWVKNEEFVLRVFVFLFHPPEIFPVSFRGCLLELTLPRNFLIWQRVWYVPKLKMGRRMP